MLHSRQHLFRLRPYFLELIGLSGNSVLKRKHMNTSTQHHCTLSDLYHASLLLCIFQPLILSTASPKYRRPTRSPSPARQSKLLVFVLTFAFAKQVGTIFQPFVLSFCCIWQVGTILLTLCAELLLCLAGWHHFPAIDHL